MSFDISLLYALHGLTGRSEWFDVLVLFLADGFDVLLLILTLVLILFLYDPNKQKPFFSFEELTQRIKGLGMVLLSTFISWSVVASLKSLFAAPRPFLVLPDIEPLLFYGGFDSFPSNHAAVFAALAVSLFIYNRTIGSLFAFFAILIGLARIIAGIHFPFDILSGYVLGGLIAWLVYSLYTYIKQHISVTLSQ